MSLTRWLGGLPLLLVFVLPSVTATAQLPEGIPARLGFDAERLGRIDAAIARAIERRQVPGAVVLVGRKGAIAYSRVAGKRALDPTPEDMTRDTVFDMASLTKPIATATALMILLDEGRVRVADQFTSTLKEWDNRGKGSVTIEQLLRHRAGSSPTIL